MKMNQMTGLFLLFSFELNSQNFNRPVPAEVIPYEFTRFDSVDHGYYLTTPFAIGTPSGTGNLPQTAMILDANGFLSWYMPIDAHPLLDFKYHPDYQQYSFINAQSPEDIRFTLMNLDLQLLDSFTTTGNVTPDLHEFLITNNQTYFLSGLRDSIMDLSAYTFNGNPGSTQTHAIGFVIQEMDENRQVQFQWNSNDYLHPSEAYDNYGYSSNYFDYAHGNAISEEMDGGMLVSLRNTNGIYKINRQTGAVEWKLGGKFSSFTFANDPGFSAQHDVRRLPNGNITLFDNANMTSSPPRSRAVEYSLDTVNWVATKIWEYKYSPGFFSPAMGNHQTTDQRLHLINYGFNFRPYPSFVLTDDEGQLLSQLFFRDSFVSYRSFLFDIPFPESARPLISCSQQGDSLVLSAPEGYARYQWSTGESSSTISTTQPGIYQVWVNYGAGMLGSLPFEVNSSSGICTIIGVRTPESIEDSTITGYFDLLGRAIPQPPVGTVYLVRFANGKAKLNVRLE